MHSTAQYSVQRKSIPDWQLWILAVVILIGCWYSDRSIKCACSWPTSRQWMESKEPEALTTIQPSNIKRPAMSNAFPCITATEPTNQWNGLQRCLSCMCGTAAEIWGTFFFLLGSIDSPAHLKTLRLWRSFWGVRARCLTTLFNLRKNNKLWSKTDQLYCWNISPKELSFKAAATHVTNKHVSGLWTLTVTFKAVRHFHHSASPQSTNYRYVIPAFKRTVCSDRHNALFWCWRNEMPPSSKL